MKRIVIALVVLFVFAAVGVICVIRADNTRKLQRAAFLEALIDSKREIIEQKHGMHGEEIAFIAANHRKAYGNSKEDELETYLRQRQEEHRKEIEYWTNLLEQHEHELAQLNPK